MGVFKDCGCGCKGTEQKKKFMASITSALLFFIIANPETFILVRRLLGNWVASATGYPTTAGLILHAFVFMLVVWLMMNLNRRENAEGDMKPSTMTAGALPQPVAEGPATPDGILPPIPGMEQPMVDTTTKYPSPTPAPTVTKGTMSQVSSMLGGLDINSASSPATPTPAVYGNSWRQCACGDGTQVMIMK
jgi:hypothetical protein